MCVMCHAVFECDSAVDYESRARLQRFANVFLFPSRVLIALTQIFLSCKRPLQVLEGFSSFARKKGDLFEYFVERLLTLYKVTCVFKCGELICYARKQP